MKKKKKLKLIKRGHRLWFVDHKKIINGKTVYEHVMCCISKYRFTEDKIIDIYYDVAKPPRWILIPGGIKYNHYKDRKLYTKLPDDYFIKQDEQLTLF